MPAMQAGSVTQGGQLQQGYPVPQNMPQLQRTSTAPQIPAYSNATPSGASANMWTDSVARALDSSGMKRRWDGNMSYLGDQSQAKRVR